jgi:hypothetical protein
MRGECDIGLARQTIRFIMNKRVRIGPVCGGNEEIRGCSKLLRSIRVTVALYKERMVLLRERCIGMTNVQLVSRWL